MNKIVIALACGLGLALLGLGEPAIKDRSVIGYWKFDDGNSSADVSGYGGGIVSLGSNAEIKNSDGHQNSGYANLKSKGKTFSATLGENAPAFNGKTTMPYFTYVTRFRSSEALASGKGTAQDIINDTVNWHFAAQRYQPDRITSSGYTSMLVLDPRWRDSDFEWVRDDGTIDENRELEIANNYATGLISVNGKNVTLGGAVRLAYSTSVDYKGGIDEAYVINRLMSKRELTRMSLTGETFVYSLNNTPSFSSYSSWSNAEGSYNKNPGELKGAAYIVDGSKTMTQNSSGTFGSDVANKISLTLGRLQPLSFMFGGQQQTIGTVGNFAQGAGTEITFYDLRLNDGTITAGGTSLTTTLLDVNAPASKPFVLAAANDFALNVGEATTGSGVLKKTGAGKLTVNQWAGSANLRIAEGSVKTTRLDGYTGGTVLVSTDSTVAFSGDDVMPTTENKMKIAFDGAKPTAKVAVMSVPVGVAAAMIVDTTSYEGGKVGLVMVENGTVYVEPGYPEDQGAVPVLMVE